MPAAAMATPIVTMPSALATLMAEVFMGKLLAVKELCIMKC
jgi:hypothetical protein